MPTDKHEKEDGDEEEDREQHESLKASMEKVKERVDVLERWRWMIVGGAIVIGYLMGHLDFFAKFLK